MDDQDSTKIAKLDQPLQQQPPLDRLSSLPDAIIGDILSLIPINTAVSTSVLSHRWHFLWTHITSLYLDCRHFPLQTFEFYTVIDSLLPRLTFLSTFSVCAPYPRQQHYEPWLRTLCTLNVTKIDIDMHCTSPLYDFGIYSPFAVPHCIFQTQSLVCLVLPTYWLDYELPNDIDVIINLPNLRKLASNLSNLQCGFVSKLVSSCPLLEELSLSPAKCWSVGPLLNNDVIIQISSGSLERLELNLHHVRENVEVVIDAPKLDWFYLCASRLKCCSFVNKPIALREAIIYTCIQPLVLSILPVISNVSVLHLHGSEFGLFEGFKDEMGISSIFHNLTELKLELKAFYDELISFPFNITTPSLLLGIEKITIVVKSIENSTNLKKLTEYFLSNAPALKMLSFAVSPYYETVKKKLVEMLLCLDLYSCSLNSPQCLIQFEGQHAKLPANVAELLELENKVKELRELQCQELVVGAS